MSVPELVEQGITALKANQFAEAESLLTKIGDIDNQNGKALFLLGLAQLWSDQFDEAIRTFRKYLKRNTNNKFAWYYLGEALANYKSPWCVGPFVEIEEAEEAYLKAIELDDQYVEPRLGLANLNKRENHQFKKAIEIALQATEISPNIADTWRILGTMLVQQLAFGEKRRNIETEDPLKPFEGIGNIQDLAQEAFQKAVNLDPKNSENWAKFGDYYSFCGKMEKAIECYQRAVELEPTFVPYLTKLGDMTFETKNYTLAEKVYLQLSRLQPKYEFNLALAYHRQEQYEKAEKLFHKLLNSDQDTYYYSQDLIIYYLGEIYFDTERYEKAENCFLQIAEDYLNALFFLSRICHNKGDIAQAKQYLYEILDEDENYTLIWHELAFNHATEENYELAKDAFIQAVRLDGKYEEQVIKSLTKWYTEAGKEDELSDAIDEVKANSDQGKITVTTQKWKIVDGVKPIPDSKKILKKEVLESLE